MGLVISVQVDLNTALLDASSSESTIYEVNFKIVNKILHKERLLYMSILFTYSWLPCMMKKDKFV
ncbi:MULTISPECIES: hypothetical protein [Paraliobacillus]|uniref:hypothetical protein n=1 Tax=Paraliobacillus TaxID=200903 RepID=UPI000DD42796|nr:MULTISPECIES: hypothetical protein [Paraliobacillus]